VGILGVLMTFADLFAGIGGIRIAFERAGFQCVFANDIDAKCKMVYDLNFGDEMVLGDIADISANQIPDFDVLTAGFPCQPFSIAGHRKGFEDERSNTFFEVVRILKEKRPRAFLLENVGNLKSHDNENTINVIYKELSKLNYYFVDQIMNAMEYGNIPQNRERIYIVGFRDEDDFRRFGFPRKIWLNRKVSDFLEKEVPEKYYYNGKPLFEKLKDFVVKKGMVYQWRMVYGRENKNNVCPTLTANMGEGGHNVPIILDDKGIRKLTPRECANLQGFPNTFKFPDVSDYSLYKMIGNSVVVSVVERIAVVMKQALEGSEVSGVRRCLI
jgi:DNA (cytosine-5)-methyltransferase 1